jgi:tRNA 2-selenouridine synthase
MDSDQNPSKTQPFVAESHPLETVAGLVHPHQLEVQDFSAYALIVDARPAQAFADDHIPAAVNWPVLSDSEQSEFERHLQADRSQALLFGAAHVRANMNSNSLTALADLKPASRLLVYGAGGDLRGWLCAGALREHAFDVDELLGGYKSYRRWVGTGLALLPRLFLFRVLGGPSGCGQAILLRELAGQGQQVLDLANIAAHDSSPFGAQPGKSQPAQLLFESMLLDTLRHRDAWRPLWVMASPATLGSLQLPGELDTALQRAPNFEVVAPMAERVKFWCRRDPQDAADPVAWVERLAQQSGQVEPGRLIDWRGLAQAGEIGALVEQFLIYGDELESNGSTGDGQSHPAPLAKINLESLETSAIAEAAARLIASPGG